MITVQALTKQLNAYSTNAKLHSHKRVMPHENMNTTMLEAWSIIWGRQFLRNQIG
jgi:hypothetical protein